MYQTEFTIETTSLKDIEKYKCIRNIDLNDGNVLDYIINLSKKINVDFGSLYMYPDWFLIDGNYYYFKAKKFLNEIIMSEILNMFNLPHLDYELVKNGDITGIISKSFRKMDKLYFYYDDFINYLNGENVNTIDKFNALMSKNYSNVDVKNMLDIIYKTISIDYMFGQRDRESYNVLFELSSSNINLLANYDNGNILKKSYTNEYYSCFESLSFIANNKLDYHNMYTIEVLEKYKELQDALGSSANIDLNEIFKIVESKYPIFIEEDTKKLIIDYYDNQRKILSNTLKLM